MKKIKSFLLIILSALASPLSGYPIKAVTLIDEDGFLVTIIDDQHAKTTKKETKKGTKSFINQGLIPGTELIFEVLDEEDYKKKKKYDEVCLVKLEIKHQNNQFKGIKVEVKGRKNLYLKYRLLGTFSSENRKKDILKIINPCKDRIDQYKKNDGEMAAKYYADLKKKLKRFDSIHDYIVNSIKKKTLTAQRAEYEFKKRLDFLPLDPELIHRICQAKINKKKHSVVWAGFDHGTNIREILNSWGFKILCSTGKSKNKNFSFIEPISLDDHFRKIPLFPKIKMEIEADKRWYRNAKRIGFIFGFAIGASAMFYAMKRFF